MIRSLRRRLDRLELAREPALSTGDDLVEVLEEFVATASPEECARVLALIDRVMAERGDQEMAGAVAELSLPNVAPEPAPAEEPPACAPPTPDPVATPAAEDEHLPAYLQWQLVINKPPPGPRPPPPPPYRDPLDDPFGMYE